ncbi:MAG: hypothetical protein ACRDQX_10745 [Pseudonocardiaceae bacterium]
MSFLNTLVTNLEQAIVKAIEGLLSKAESNGSVSVDEVRATTEEIKGHLAQPK